jgi:hypothetical protein
VHRQLSFALCPFSELSSRDQLSASETGADKASRSGVAYLDGIRTDGRFKRAVWLRGDEVLARTRNGGGDAWRSSL